MGVLLPMSARFLFLLLRFIRVNQSALLFLFLLFGYISHYKAKAMPTFKNPYISMAYDVFLYEMRGNDNKVLLWVMVWGNKVGIGGNTM